MKVINFPEWCPVFHVRKPETVKLILDIDEWYPVYFFSERISESELVCGKAVDVPKETADRWKSAFANFQSAQNEIKEFLGKQKP